jgi:hypothetical protein
MVKISKELEEKLLQHPDVFGYCCEYGAVIGNDREFVVWEEKDEIFLVHKGEIISEGVLVKLKKQ